MCVKPVGTLLFATLMLCGFAGSPAFAQEEPWDLFLDTESSSACDVVNAENTELVVLSDTGQLVIVTGPDVILEDTFVDQVGNVFLGVDPVGFIDFAEDGDGFRTLWWLSLTGNVVNVDGFTGEPTETNFLPIDFFDVPCDACPFWDDPTVCGVSDPDSDLDGITDTNDLCPWTPIDEAVDEWGCSCSQLDDDLDGVSNCIDLCPESGFLDDVDIFGCALPASGPIFNFRGFGAPTAMAMTAVGLVATGLVRRRWR